MTVPPGGPYGQDPYGANPYGQGPYWGGPPPTGPQQGGPPPYPPGGPYSGPQSGAYPYPPTGPFTNPQGGMDPSYPGQPFGQAGPPYAPGWPPGSYPPGPPPNGPRSNMPWLIVAGIAVLGVIALVVILIVSLNNEPKSPRANPSGPSSSTAAPTSQPGGSGQTATDCTPNVSGGDKPAGGAPIKAGKLSFPANAAPGWVPFSDDQTPNLIGAVGLAQEVPGASQWVMQAEVAVTNFVPSMDVSAQAAKLMNCVAEGPGYSNASPTLGPIKKSSITVEGIKAARVDADVTIADPARNVKGDAVVIIAVDTKPVTIFLGATPIGDAASAGLLNQVIGSLKVSK
ncbi:hypothetical protein AWC29_04855 [Mycobacterium triplex]|uniref:Membrane glycine and proline rich protein n=1 Tax=Mycobacterium triplex TaxID=47839 RepID=A0A024K4Q2_9MYCO|nr:hypothetical protein [Mycobacterium triplex]ORX08377.1 hypothetical protein AWC29_04855 [Mycobacterium triplex]CDO90478.1 membrane glycine and proline rich protein [Mycobacterium triplex]